MDRVDGEASERAPRVLVIEVARGSMKNNCYLIVDPATHEAVMVDPAWQMEKIQAALHSTGSRLSGILLTHAHHDHTDLAEPLADAYNCPIWMSRKEIDGSGFTARQLVGTVGQMFIRPIPTPGHTPGCTCYLVGNNLFTGDVLFPEGCGICPHVEAAHQMFESLQRLKSRLRPDTRIFAGHTYLNAPGQQFADVLAQNMYLHFTDAQSFAAFRLRKGQDVRKLLAFR